MQRTGGGGGDFETIWPARVRMAKGEGAVLKCSKGTKTQSAPEAEVLRYWGAQEMFREIRIAEMEGLCVAHCSRLVMHPSQQTTLTTYGPIKEGLFIPPSQDDESGSLALSTIKLFRRTDTRQSDRARFLHADMAIVFPSLG